MNVAIDSSIYRQASDYAQSRGLNINPGSVMGAAIGASGDACGNIVIEGGIITAKGVQGAATSPSPAA